ncbi:hypothetical protein BBOV_I002175 [Babesia bovis T2Bo]|uniref:hypothetical protein n=1 Tax=Babesia bovis T2Bo TaxID=484906 RepID=UPI001C3520BB|nr:hypothetical protein BBOV_I002175 [Babesia bovis T2Bo]KAG6440225.1 hypothetical protein BBOV_I002175 [Babesia bovis T2Bo]
MRCYIALILIFSYVQASVKPRSAVFGALQTPVPQCVNTRYRFVGVYDPGNGIYWRARRRSFLDDASAWLGDLVDTVRYRDSGTSLNICPRGYLYRIYILDKVNAIKNAVKRGIISISLDNNKVNVTRNGFLRKFMNNCY